MRILSDCNSVFISHMLTGAKVNTRVKEVITNLSSFVRSQPATPNDSDNAGARVESPPSDAESSSETPDKLVSAASRDESGVDGRWELTKGRLTGGKGAASHRMMIQPRHDWTVSSHGCPICPANLCKVGFSADIQSLFCAGAGQVNIQGRQTIYRQLSMSCPKFGYTSKHCQPLATQSGA